MAVAKTSGDKRFGSVSSKFNLLNSFRVPTHLDVGDYSISETVLLVKFLRGREAASRLAHNQKIVGSSPTHRNQDSPK